MIQSKINDIDKALEILHAPGKSTLKLWEVLIMSKLSSALAILKGEEDSQTKLLSLLKSKDNLLDAKSYKDFAFMCWSSCLLNNGADRKIQKYKVEAESVKPENRQDVWARMAIEASIRSYLHVEGVSTNPEAKGKASPRAFELNRQVKWFINYLERKIAKQEGVSTNV